MNIIVHIDLHHGIRNKVAEVWVTLHMLTCNLPLYTCGSIDKKKILLINKSKRFKEAILNH